jgi:hypothetical protein
MSITMRVRRLLVAGALAPALGCATMSRSTTPEPATNALVVRNQGYFDLNVYVVPSGDGQAFRLGTVPGNSTVRFPLRPNELQAGGFLTVRVHPIGTQETWTSEAVGLPDGVVAVLNANVTSRGDCSASMLYTIASTLAPRDR